jgi:hypothetical protein
VATVDWTAVGTVGAILGTLVGMVLSVMALRQSHDAGAARITKDSAS